MFGGGTGTGRTGNGSVAGHPPRGPSGWRRYLRGQDDATSMSLHWEPAARARIEHVGFKVMRRCQGGPPRPRATDIEPSEV